MEELGVSDGRGAGSESDSEELDGEAAGGEVEEEAILLVFIFRLGTVRRGPFATCILSSVNNVLKYQNFHGVFMNIF